VYWNVAFDFGVMLMQFRDQATSYNPKKAHCAVIRGLVGSIALETVSITNWFNSVIKRDKGADNFQVSQFTSPALDQQLPSLLRLV
jgi:hypothetical protein